MLKKPGLVALISGLVDGSSEPGAVRSVDTNDKAPMLTSSRMTGENDGKPSVWYARPLLVTNRGRATFGLQAADRSLRHHSGYASRGFVRMFRVLRTLLSERDLKSLHQG